VLVDDHPMLRRMLRIACQEQGLEIVGEAWDGVDAVDLCLQLQPAVIVLDLGLPRLHGFEVVRQLKDRGSEARILVLTGSDERDALIRALELGVDGFVEKTAETDEIVASILMVARGRYAFAGVEHRARSDLLRLAQRARVAAAFKESLTPREIEVLRLVAGGLTNRQIASALSISPATAKVHIANLYSKLEVQSRVQALRKALELGLFDTDQGAGFKNVPN
jgi:DNA-binding NarL/FixJ family response regulator